MSILIYTDNSGGKITKSSLDVIYYGSKLAKALNTEAVAVTVGEVTKEELSRAGNYGAGKAVHIRHDLLKNFDSKAWSKAVCQVAAKVSADIIVFGHGFSSKALAPRLAALLKAGLIVNAVDIAAISDGKLTVKRSVYAGKAFSYFTTSAPKKIITVQPNILSPEITSQTATVEEFSPDLSPADCGTEVTEVNKTTGKILLTEASVIVSGGRGMKGPENWHLLETLAGMLSAGIACSKPVADMHWRPHSEHVGQTGLAVRPNLYIAVGISGAIQHLAGVNGSKYIVAINTDPEAPIFREAAYGIVGDAFKVLPRLNEAVKKLQS
ncbi:MAG: electron transfer flavoprotein subunit alpha/FixB family protein [Bacteroidetes bacterium]|nr:electron transfer flavoprotein subunit alpha/FixB family protein [Bacteroidota bacterium]